MTTRMSTRSARPLLWRGTQIPWAPAAIMVGGAGIAASHWLHLSNERVYPVLTEVLMIMAALATAAIVAILGRHAAARAAVTAELVNAVHQVLGWPEPAHGIVKGTSWRPDTSPRSGHGVTPGKIRMCFTPTAPTLIKQPAVPERLRTGQEAAGHPGGGANPEWLRLINSALAETLGRRYQLSVDRRTSRLTAIPSTAEPEADDPPSIKRLRSMMSTLFESGATVTDYTLNDKGRITDFAVKHDISIKLAAAGPSRIHRIERTISQVLPGRWRGDFKLTEDTAAFQLRPRLPKLLWPRIYPEADPGGVVAAYKNTRFVYAYDEDRQPISWHPRTVPHRLIIGPTGSGKALDVNTPIATPTGWTTMGELKTGDTVFDELGHPCTVTGVYDQPLTDNCYEVTFCDGSTIIADGDHLWYTYDRSGHHSAAPPATQAATSDGHRTQTAPTEQPMAEHGCGPAKVRTTDEIRATCRSGSRLNHCVALTAPLILPDAQLPIPPYTLGAWLAAQSSDHDLIAARPEIIDRICGDGYLVTMVDSTTPTDARYRIDGLAPQLHSLGLLHKDGYRQPQQVPGIYLRASGQQRRELLAGFLDTGALVGQHTIEYTTTTNALAEAVLELSNSLGYRTLPRQTRTGAWTVLVEVGDTPPHRHRHRVITRVDKVPPRPTRCITVNSPRHLYLAGTSMIPTHNTSTIHTFITQAARAHWAVNIVDRKNIEYRGFRDWPNVQCVATRIEDQIALIHRIWLLMKERYEAGEAGTARTEDFTPLMLVLDEFTELIKDIAAWYVKLRSSRPAAETRGWPKELPIEEQVGSLLRLGRTARIHVIIGMQRPDVKYVEGENRDNLGGRQSLGRLGRNGADMLWGDYYTGTTIPPGLQGRGMAYNDHGEPVEVQNFFTPDPYKPDDITDPTAQRVLKEIRPTTCSHQRIVFDTPFDPHGDTDFHYNDYLQAPIHFADQRPDLDPLSPQYRFKPHVSGDSSAAVAALAPREHPTTITAALPSARRAGDSSNAPWPGYGSPAPRHIDDLQVGDLICVDAATRNWAILERAPEPDLVDPEAVTLSVRDANDDFDLLTVAADSTIISRPLLDDDDA